MNKDETLESIETEMRIVAEREAGIEMDDHLFWDAQDKVNAVCNEADMETYNAILDTIENLYQNLK